MAEEVVAEAKGTKEINEMIDGIALIARAGMQVAKDGKVDLSDLQVLISLVKDHGAILAAIEGAGEIPAEIKDLSLEEAQALLMKLIATVAAVKAA